MMMSDLAAFRNALPQGGRLIGLDVGSKTLGLALCDARWVIASPAQTLVRGKLGADLATLEKLMMREQVAGVIIGDPRNMDGTVSPQTQSVRAFARSLAQHLPSLPLLLWDERWSTQAVTRTLIDADISRARRAEVVDKLAASYILQGAIDALRWQWGDG